MPLPESGTPWPPRQLASITSKIQEWDAWYVGDPDALATVYGGRTPSGTARRNTGGILGALQRMWWGRQMDQSVDRPDAIHLPVAADLARASADLLYSDPPQLRIATPNADATVTSKTQARLDSYIDSGLHDILATGAEVGAALGGRYHRVTWDRNVEGKPFLSTVDADGALPTWRWGRLIEVTFWYVLSWDGQRVVRHLEHHELDAAGMGLVQHAVYEGTPGNLGQQVSLAEYRATRALVVDADGYLIEGRTPGLLVAYVPNQTPNRTWRTDPVGRYLGRSDFDGIEPLMDGADETYASLMRDVRIAKGRLIVPSEYLESKGPGKGVGFNLDREVYEALHIPPSEDGGASTITPQQFAIRATEHLAVIDDAVQRAIHGAGYSVATFGDGVEGGVMTAAEVHSRERRTYSTRDRKIRHEKPAVAYLARKMLAVDAAVFGTPGLDPTDIDVVFADTVQDSALSMAQTAQALYGAKAASTYTRVALVHPDWDPKQVAEEVARIMAEEPAPLADPFAIGG